ncbi:MAG: response regulator [Bdellovibrionaceae bacterium]|nr:response regulator [Pseudobdellovibrionaceae bacterium]
MNKTFNRSFSCKRILGLHSRSSRLDFLAHICHEIRNPLFGIVGTTSLLCKTTLSEEQKKYIHVLESSSRGLMGMVDDVLDYSKFSRGILEVHQRDFCLRSITADVAKLFSGPASEKGISLECFFDSNLHDFGYFGGAERLRQVLINFVSNGVKYTDSGNVCIFWKVVSDSERSQVVRCEVQDSGSGISSESRLLVFEPFFRIDHSSKVSGAGLGLSISKMIIEQMRGEIGLVSENKQGATFWFEVTLQKSEKKAMEDKIIDVQGTDFDFSHFKVLVAEDNVVNQSILGKMFKNMGVSYEIVNDGREALNKLRQDQYDLILMDCYMAPMNGFDTAQLVRRSPESFHNLPILAFTASSDLTDVKRCLESGMNDVILKPVTYELLLEKVRCWLQRRLDDIRVLDESVLEKIRTSDNSDQSLIHILLKMYHENTDSDFHQMFKMLGEGDLDGLRKRAHRLKSSAAQLGAMRFEKYCHLMECAKDLDRAKAIRLFRRMVAEHGRSLEKFRSYCQKIDQNSAALI